MVYCGKPSRGCQMCRTRRIKCDEGKPTCAQCAKSRRQCPGYKDDFDLVFRNETQATEKRAKKSSAKAKRVAAQAVVPSQRRASDTVATATSTFDFQYEPGFIPQHQQQAIQPVPAWVPATLTIPIDQIATHFFFSNFVTIPNNHDSRGFLDYMIPLVNSDQSNKTLSLAFSAASLAALANRPNAKSLLLKAEERYSRAIRYVNHALRDPVEQKTDQTLAAVLLLGLFESIMSRKVSMTAWGSHIDGAVMIIKMRGRNQLKTKLGHALFTAVRLQMIVNALATGKSPDWNIDDWTADTQGREENADDVIRLALQLAELRCNINKQMTLVARSPENIALISNLIQQILEIEQGFAAWEAQLPDFWRPRTVAWVDNIHLDVTQSEVFPGKIDVFSDIWICNVWNLVRVSKLFISGTIIRCAAWLHAPGDYRTTPEYAAAARLGVDAVCDTMAAIPYHLGWTSSKEFQTKFGLADGYEFACGSENVAPRSLGAFIGIWPLFSCYCSDFATDAQRAYAKSRLEFITDVMGLNQAKTLSGYQLRLPSMTVKRDQFAVAMMIAGQQAAAASAAAAAQAAKAQASYQPPALPSSSPQYTGTSTYSPPTTSATTYIPAPPQTPQMPPTSTLSTSTYPPSASTASSATYPPSTASAGYPQSNASANYPPSTASTNSPPPMPPTPQSIPAPPTAPSAAMQLQFMAFMKADATPDAALQAAFDAAEAKQRSDWARECAVRAEREAEERETEERERREWEAWEREAMRRQRAEEQRGERVKSVLEGKKRELIEEATGGDSRMAELIERYLAVGMFDEI